MNSSSFLGADKGAPWMYFLAGAVLPSLAWYFQLKKQPVIAPPPIEDVNNNDLDDDSDYDSEDDDSITHDTTTTPATAACTTWTRQDAPYKMMLVVNTELNMTKGKIAAQCGHAAVGCYQKAINKCPVAVKAWQDTGCAKIAVKCPTVQELNQLYTTARANHIPCYLVEDAGRTQIAAGSRTVLGMLGPAAVFQGVCDHFKLL